MAGPAKARRDSFAAVDAPVPPHSIEAEQAVIGGLLLDASAWDNVADVVKQEDFYRPDHQQIFEAIGLLAGLGKPCDVVTVSEQLERSEVRMPNGALRTIGDHSVTLHLHADIDVPLAVTIVAEE